MSDSVRHQVRLLMRDQLGRCHEAIAAREAGIRVQMLNPTAAVVERERATAHLARPVVHAFHELTRVEHVKVSDVATPHGLHFPEVRWLLRTHSQDAESLGVGERVAGDACRAEQG